MKCVGALLMAIACVLLTGCKLTAEENGTPVPLHAAATPNSKRLRLAFIPNNTSKFWTIASKGVDQALKKLDGFDVQVRMPRNGTVSEQNAIIADLLQQGVKGIAISPVDPDGQTASLNALSDKVLLVTHDSDAPQSKRLCYIGTDNIEAGRMAGRELLKAVPNGGQIAVFVGKSEAQNAKERYNGLREALAGSNLNVVGLFTDDTDRSRARQNVLDACAKHPDLAGCVGLWSYNTPAILAALDKVHKAGKIAVVGFDEEPETLAGIASGAVRATVVQQPFEFGYQSVNLMAKLLSGDKNALPSSKKIIVPTKVIDKANVADFKTTLKELLEG